MGDCLTPDHQGFLCFFFKLEEMRTKSQRFQPGLELGARFPPSSSVLRGPFVPQIFCTQHIAFGQVPETWPGHVLKCMLLAHSHLVELCELLLLDTQNHLHLPPHHISHSRGILLGTHMVLFSLCRRRYPYGVIVSTYTQDNCDHMTCSTVGANSGLNESAH